MDTPARIKRLEGHLAIVEVDVPAGGCGHCDEPGGCRSGVLNQIFVKPCREFAVANEIEARVGEQVIVRVADGTLARAALLTYLVPVLCAVAGAGFAASMAQPALADAWAAAGALGGLAASVILFRLRVARGMPQRALPQLIRPGIAGRLAGESPE